MCSPSWTPQPPPSPSHLSGSSQCTSPEHLSHASIKKNSFESVLMRWMKLEPIIHLFLNSNVFFLFYLKSSRKVLHFFWMKYLFWVILNFLLIRIVFSFSSHSLLLLFLFIWLKFLGSFLKYQVVIVSCHSYVQGAKKLME